MSRAFIYYRLFSPLSCEPFSFRINFIWHYVDHYIRHYHWTPHRILAGFIVGNPTTATANADGFEFTALRFSYPMRLSGSQFMRLYAPCYVRHYHRRANGRFLMGRRERDNRLVLKSRPAGARGRRRKSYPGRPSVETPGRGPHYSVRESPLWPAIYLFQGRQRRSATSVAALSPKPCGHGPRHASFDEGLSGRMDDAG